MNEIDIILVISSITYIFFALGMLYLFTRSFYDQISLAKHGIRHRYKLWIITHILFISLLIISIYVIFTIYTANLIETTIGQVALYTLLIGQLVFLIGFIIWFNT